MRPPARIALGEALSRRVRLALGAHALAVIILLLRAAQLVEKMLPIW
jgi:hypothetical protein